jgi:hypothetical protein
MGINSVPSLPSFNVVLYLRANKVVLYLKANKEVLYKSLRLINKDLMKIIMIIDMKRH